LALLCLAASWNYALTLASNPASWLEPGIVNNFYPLWNASRSVLHHIDPYSSEVTEQNEIAAYGMTAATRGTPVRQRFAYPVYATFPVLPLGLVNAGAARRIALCFFMLLVALLVGWLRAEWDGRTALYTILTFASYPTIFALQECHPTLLFLGLAIGAFALLRSGRLILAGMVAAFATAKPHVALPILLPMLSWSLARWHSRKRFAISLVLCSAALVCVASMLVPGWVPEWLAALRAYSQYIYPSFVVLSFGKKLGTVVSVGLLLGLAAVLRLHRERDLLFQAAICAPVIYLITPFVNYNAILLLIPAVWIADNSRFIKDAGAASQITLALLQVAFAAFWLAPPLGALLFHTTPFGKKIAWALTGIMISPLLASITAVMAVQCSTMRPPSKTMLAAATVRNQNWPGEATR
jgi:hypothetical protein